jgi:hypothetical protein
MFWICGKKSLGGGNIRILGPEISLNFSGLERRAVYRSDLLLASLDETAGIDSRVEESRRGKLAT